MSILKRGLKGAPVKRLQEKLGIDADGDYGPGTERAVREFQDKNGLAVDGIAGPDTFAAMGLHELVLLRVGSRGEQVKALQTDLGISADGRFGPGTRDAVMAFQKENGLEADGMAGPTTLAKMNSFASDITPMTIDMAQFRDDEIEFEGEDMPETAEPTQTASAKKQAAPKKSVWGKVKGWFS